MRGHEVLGWLGSGLLLLLFSCGGDDPGSAGGPPASPSSGGLSADGFPSSGGGLAAGAAAFTPPEGVDAKLWQALNAALAREIARQHPDSTPVAATSVAGSAAFNRRLKPPPPGAGVWDAVPASEWRTVPSADARSASLRRTSAPPTGTGAVVGDLALTANADGSAQFGWSYRCPGDYDQNGEVNLADLTPVGIGYGKSSSAGDWAKYEPADGDGNGEINLADVTPIGANFGATFEGYDLQHTATPANEPSWQATGAEAPLSSATAPPGGGRKAFSLAIPTGDPSLVDNEYFRVRGYVGSGAGRQYGVPSISVQYHPGAPPVVNQPPIAVLDIEPSSGLAPLDVLLDATSSGDIDGEIVKYEFDADGPLNGEAWTDMGPGGILPFSYLGSGDFLCALRVTDDGGATDTDLALVKSRDPNPPSAALTAAAQSGPTPLHVVWDASGSADADGLVVDYEWDFDNDGEYEYDSGPVPTADFYYYEPGDFPVRVKVTDNDGLSNSTTNQASPSLGASWHVQGVPTPPGFGADANAASLGLLDVDGKPGVCFPVVETNDVNPPMQNQVFIEGTDARASAWAAPSVLPADIDTGEAPLSGGDGFALGIVGGRPAYARGRFYWLAQDSTGNQWLDPVEVYPSNVNTVQIRSFISMQDVPILIGGSGVLRAANPLGTAWLPATYMLSGLGSDGGGGVVIAGKACIVLPYDYQNTSNLALYRSLAPDGTLWSAPEAFDPALSAGTDPEVVNAGGNPAVLYADIVFKTVKYCRALDSEGQYWAMPQVLAANAGAAVSAGSWQGRPVVVYQDSVSLDLMVRIANQEEGTSWGRPMLLSAENTATVYSKQTWMYAEIDGLPAVLYPGPVTFDGQYVHLCDIMYTAYW